MDGLRSIRRNWLCWPKRIYAGNGFPWLWWWYGGKRRSSILSRSQRNRFHWNQPDRKKMPLVSSVWNYSTAILLTLNPALMLLHTYLDRWHLAVSLFRIDFRIPIIVWTITILSNNARIVDLTVGKASALHFIRVNLDISWILQAVSRTRSFPLPFEMRSNYSRTKILHRLATDHSNAGSFHLPLHPLFRD